MTCPLLRLDGAYLLGALSPEERRSYEEHLAGCPSCSAGLSEVAGLPGLLARLPAEAIETGDPPPPDLLPGLLRAVASERRRSRRSVRIAAAVGTAAAVVATGVLVPVLVDSAGRPAARPAVRPVAMTRVADVPVRATAALVDKPWGTQIDLRCTYTEAADSSYNLVLVALDRDGNTEQIAVWEVISNGEARVTGSTSLRSAELAALEVRTRKGKTILRLRR